MHRTLPDAWSEAYSAPMGRRTRPAGERASRTLLSTLKTPSTLPRHSPCLRIRRYMYVRSSPASLAASATLRW